MATLNNTEPFTVSVIGDETQEKWFGTFKAKVRLSHRDHLIKDKVRRDLLGPDGNNASPRALNTAEVFSELAVRVVDAPAWWTDNDNGLGLQDDNVVGEVYKAAVKVATEAAENLKKQAEEAKKELQKSEDVIK